MLSRENDFNSIKIIDFGLQLTVYNPQQNNSSNNYDLPIYMAPELLKKK